MSKSVAKDELHIVQLYGELEMEEQRLALENPIPGKLKLVLATNLDNNSVIETQSDIVLGDSVLTGTFAHAGLKRNASNIHLFKRSGWGYSSK